MADRYEIRLPALGSGKASSTSTASGSTASGSTTSRLCRASIATTTTLQGYQRPEVLSHIRAIRRYLESDGAMLPNAIVLAFDERVALRARATQAQPSTTSRSANSSSPSTSRCPTTRSQPGWSMASSAAPPSATPTSPSSPSPPSASSLTAKQSSARSSSWSTTPSPCPRGSSTNCCPTPRATCRRRTPASNSRHRS